MKINWFKINTHSSYDLIYIFYEAITHNNIRNFKNLLIYSKQGFICRDCNTSSHYCNCNYCEICKFNICLCKYDLNNIREFLIKECKFILNRKNLNKLITHFEDYFNLDSKQPKLRKEIIEKLLS